MELTLGNRAWTVQEPVFKDLKIIIALYNQLNDDRQSAEQQAGQLLQLLKVVINDDRLFPSLWYRIRHFRTVKPITGSELQAFLNAIPELCRLEQTDSANSAKADTDNWGEIYAHLSASIGLSWDDIDLTMTLSRLKAMQDYWLKHPPAHMLKAAELGYEYQEKQSVKDFFDGIFAGVTTH